METYERIAKRNVKNKSLTKSFWNSQFALHFRRGSWKSRFAKTMGFGVRKVAALIPIPLFSSCVDGAIQATIKIGNSHHVDNKRVNGAELKKL
jgi:hypothetical protein